MFKPFIQNVSIESIMSGFHADAGENSVVIQIVDPGTSFPDPKCNFKIKHQFAFKDDDKGSGIMTEAQAILMADILKEALSNHRNVIVHCMAGLCRSGAVAEAGVRMGFLDAEAERSPNMHVLNSTLKHLGILKDEKYYKSLF